MPVYATQVCLNASQRIVRTNRIETLHSAGVPKLNFFTGLYVINSFTTLIASLDLSECPNIKNRKT